jgi:3-oxoadipate enol-lactonase
LARILVEPGMTLQCDVDDFLWPWQKAEPVVMLHGTARNANYWRRWVPYLAAEHRVYRPEVRGFGRSDVPPVGYQFDVETILSDLRAVLDQCGVESAHFVGDSSGAIHSLLLAVRDPKRVTSLVLCDMPMKIPPEVRAIFSLGEENQMAAILKYGMDEWSRRTVSASLDVENASPELVEWYLAEKAKTAPHMAAALQAAHREAEPQFAPLIEQVRAPVLLLSGDKSKLAGDQQAALVRKLPHARLKTFPGYGHGVSLLVPEECARAALQFWSEI